MSKTFEFETQPAGAWERWRVVVDDDVTLDEVREDVWGIGDAYLVDSGHNHSVVVDVKEIK